MAQSGEVIKLIVIIVVPTAIIGLGQFIMVKMRAKKKAGGDLGFELTGSESSVLTPDNEGKASEYIMQYKNSYPRESVKQGLLNMGISDSESEVYLSKYM